MKEEKDIRISIRIGEDKKVEPIVDSIKEQLKAMGIPGNKFMYKVVPLERGN